MSTKSNGKGQAVYCAFLPGLTYFKPALPKRPIDRSSRDDSLCHLVPSSFDMNASGLIASVAGEDRPVICSNPLVETTVIGSSHGTAITLNNWSGKPAPDLRVTVKMPLRFREATLASDKRVRLSQQKDAAIFRLYLDVADALILR